MKQITRNKTFETNSSSIHSLSIMNENNDNVKRLNQLTYHIRFGQFGWEYAEYKDTKTILSYIWTVLHEGRVGNDYIDLMREWLPNCTFEEAEVYNYSDGNSGYDLKSCYVDHGGNWFSPIYDWESHKQIDHAAIEELFSSKKMFANAVFNGRLATWNDNCDTDAEPEFLYPKNAVHVIIKNN
ncbi:hypothetical protein [uncultured Clostridium sp.]|uniref:hypothetical protein n=1 Tax=uncultured Clostridium sp. TaxID=59620 RepID=UPI00260372F6|nr:hypothetical protein [uncultured Clostridium sp.]